VFEVEEQNLGGRKGQEGLGQGPGDPPSGEEEGRSLAPSPEITPSPFLKR